MPVRRDKPNQEKREYDYDELLVHIRKKIDGEYGGLAKFIKSEKFVECGFEPSPNETARMMTVLSLPADGMKKKVRSFQILKKLYKGLLGVDLENTLSVVRVQKIVTTALIE